MRSDRNHLGRDAVVKLSLDDWEMRSDRNSGVITQTGTDSLDDWEMRSDRNSRDGVAALQTV